MDKKKGGKKEHLFPFVNSSAKGKKKRRDTRGKKGNPYSFKLSLTKKKKKEMSGSSYSSLLLKWGWKRRERGGGEEEGRSATG